MRSTPLRSTASAAAAALMLAAAGLAGCGREHAPETAPPPPAAAEQPLAGAPDAAPPTVYAAPQEPPPGEPMMEAPSAAPGIVAMAPIPNPPEPDHRARRRHARRRTYRLGAAPAVHRMHPHRMRSRHVRLHRTHTARRSRGHRTHVATGAAPVRHASTKAPTASAPPMRGHGHRQTSTPTTVGASKPNANTGANAGASPRTDRVAALQTALAGAATTSAVLAAPHFALNTPADVTLTVPAGFADTLRTEAGRQGLADDAASAALTSRLSGDGYVVIPDAAQRQVIVAGQPTVFHWTATQQPGARGPLQAQLGAQLLGGGQDQLDLGTVKAGASGGVGWKVVGGVLLALVIALVVALFARSGRNTPAVIERRRAASVQRPFDIGGDEPPRV